MRKVWAVAMREYRVNVRSKGFVIGVILMPLFMGGSVIVQTIMEKRGDSSVKRVAVIDHTGSLFARLNEAAQQRNKNEVFDPETGKQMEPTFELVEIAPTAGDRPAQLLELSEKVRSSEYFAFIEIEKSVFDAKPDSADTGAGIPGKAMSLKQGAKDGESAGCDIRYYSNQNTFRDLPEWLHYIIGERVKAVRFAKAGLDQQVVWQALAPVSIDRYGLLSRSETGEVKQAEEANIASSFMIPFFVMMMMFMLLMVAVQPLLQGVLEEKMQRISEVLLGSLRPFELMLGKLIGHTFVAMTLLGIYAAGGFFVARHYGMTDMIDPALVGWFLFFLTLAIFMYGSMFLAAGACCNDVKEAQSLMMPVMFPMILPMIFLVPILRDPSGGVATGLSLFPLTSPLIMTMRKAMEVPVPLWQAPAALLGCGLVTLMCVWAAGRVFRVGLLMQGKPPKVAEILKWAIRG